MEAVKELDKHRNDLCRSRYKCAYVIQTLKYDADEWAAGGHREDRSALESICLLKKVDNAS